MCLLSRRPPWETLVHSSTIRQPLTMVSQPLSSRVRSLSQRACLVQFLLSKVHLLSRQQLQVRLRFSKVLSLSPLQLLRMLTRHRMLPPQRQLHNRTTQPRPRQLVSLLLLLSQPLPRRHLTFLPRHQPRNLTSLLLRRLPHQVPHQVHRHSSRLMTTWTYRSNLCLVRTASSPDGAVF